MLHFFGLGVVVAVAKGSREACLNDGVLDGQRLVPTARDAGGVGGIDCVPQGGQVDLGGLIKVGLVDGHEDFVGELVTDAGEPGVVVDLVARECLLHPEKAGVIHADRSRTEVRLVRVVEATGDRLHVLVDGHHDPAARAALRTRVRHQQAKGDFRGTSGGALMRRWWAWGGPWRGTGRGFHCNFPKGHR